MSKKLVSCLFYVVEAGLDPFEPVVLREAGRHLVHSLVFEIDLKFAHSRPLERSDVVPAIVDLAVVLRSFVMGHHVLPIWEVVVRVRRWNVVGVLDIVAGIVRVSCAGRLDRLPPSIKVFLICPLLVVVSRRNWIGELCLVRSA